MGCDFQSSSGASIPKRFNPRTHMGCDTVGICTYRTITKFQSTHPHGVRLPQLDLAHVGIDSFNPRTHMGCDLSSKDGVAFVSRFNPRTHMGCDVSRQRNHVSILWFQSTHPHGVRPLQTAAFTRLREFQSTHPHGVRLGVPKFYKRQPSRFNPRTHMGCDCL